MRVPFILGAIAVAGFASAFTGVMPNAFASTEAPGVFSLTSTTAGGRTYQYTIAAAQMTSFVNSRIDGMTWRLNNAATAGWPNVTTSFSQFDIEFGAGVAPGLMSNTFAANFTGGTTMVRSGALSFAPNSFLSGATGSTPNAFGVVINFSTPYLYTGGDLAIQMRFSTQSGATTQPAFDAVAATDTANGWGSQFAGRWTGSSVGVTGGNANMLVTQFRATAVPEPASMAVLGLGVAALIRRRRR